MQEPSSTRSLVKRIRLNFTSRSYDLPPLEHYRHTDDTAIDFSGIDHSADESLRKDEIVMDYTAWGFHGLVWFCRERLRFCCEVSRYGRAVATVVADILNDIRQFVSGSFGWIDRISCSQ